MTTTQHNFSNAESKINEIFLLEGINTTTQFKSNFIALLSKLNSYEEEGRKIKASIFVSYNIDLNELRRTTAQNFYLKIKTDNITGCCLDKIIKSVLPLCENGWIIMILISDHSIEYGLCRSFTGPQGLSFLDTILLTCDYPYLIVEVLNKHELKISRKNETNDIIDLRFLSFDYVNSDEAFNNLSIDLISGLDDTINTQSMNKVFNKIIRNVSRRCHGTILGIWDSTTCGLSTVLPDGVWFEDPIDLTESAFQLINDTRDIYLSEKFYALSGLFNEFSNIDGITMLNNKGQILGYNIFITKEFECPVEITGGARKRASKNLLHSKLPGLIGVYFQSQDGFISYERVKDIE